MSDFDKPEIWKQNFDPFKIKGGNRHIYMYIYTYLIKSPCRSLFHNNHSINAKCR